MAKLTRAEERRHAQACQLVDLRRDLTEDERWFVLSHWQESSTAANGLQGAFFTPEGLARDMSLEVGGDRILDLGAGIGRLAWHNRDLWGRWPNPAPELWCVERNPTYVRVGRKVLPEATWLCADILDLPDLADQQAEIRLPNGDHGQVLITNMSMQADSNGPRVRLNFTGNGPPPGD